MVQRGRNDKGFDKAEEEVLANVDGLLKGGEWEVRNREGGKEKVATLIRIDLFEYV